MKKLLLIGALTAALLLTGCGQPQTPPDNGGQTVQPPAGNDAQVPASGDRNPTAAELGREETTALKMSVEGTEEEVPATLAIRQGYSIYIPDEGWKLETDSYDDGAVYEDTWESTVNDDVEIGVRCYTGMTAEEARERFLRDEDDYVFEDLMGGDLGDPLIGGDPEDGDKLSFMTASAEELVYVIYWKYPAEAAEGFGARLPVIGGTFQLHA